MKGEDRGAARHRLFQTGDCTATGGSPESRSQLSQEIDTMRKLLAVLLLATFSTMTMSVAFAKDDPPKKEEKKKTTKKKDETPKKEG